MYIDYSTWESFAYKLNSLWLDLNNPRIRYKGENLNQTQIIKFLIKNENVYSLAKKISEEGYFVGEEPIICIENDKKIVLEGNRRTAALKILKDPDKYLSRGKAKILKDNIAKNNIDVDRKVSCYIAPNRLLANPIIYERHNGATLQQWKTGNQYSFVAQMKYEDGLTIEEICDVLNETKGNVIKPLRAYNLFLEGKEVLEKEADIDINIVDFDITNLERFFLYKPARELLGVDFDSETGDLIINLPRVEFEKRIQKVFTVIIESERFSREFNTDKDKAAFLEALKKESDFDFTILPGEHGTSSRSSELDKNVQDKKGEETTRRRKRRKGGGFTSIIPKEKDLIFGNDKLDSLFEELKKLPKDKKYSFALLLRTYLEQCLYFYLKKNELLGEVADKASKRQTQDAEKKVDQLINYLVSTHSLTTELDKEAFMRILRFHAKPKDFTNTSLKVMLDYVVNHRLRDAIDDALKFRNIKAYADQIKLNLDLAVHNIETVIDVGHNTRAWKHLEPVFDYLCTNLPEE